MTGASTERGPREQVLHDLRTPLSVIKGSIEALRGHWDHLEDGRRSELLNRALVNVDGLAAAIDAVGRRAAMPNGAASGRARLAAIEVTRRDRRFAVEVSISCDGGVVVGRVECAAGRAAELRAVAEAVLRAVSDRNAQPTALEDAEVVDVGTDHVAAVRLSRGTRALLGAALVDADDHDAVAQATLHALGRVLGADS